MEVTDTVSSTAFTTIVSPVSSTVIVVFVAFSTTVISVLFTILGCLGSPGRKINEKVFCMGRAIKISIQNIHRH
ncbi:MAG: hypothetical protein DRQ40_10790 [Gammaproteobacteria bacterium]|nr:MAG: hypothetical protein DRQ40_10790 [Gammaproteobacteria bacterium]RKZ97077.1 MAG: hypothetical protein DRQ42_09980 [Gammaproteobacteria bacterium]